MLNVYAAKWCPHCRATVQFLEKENIPFQYIDMDQADAATEKKLDDVNGGSWVIPTLEFEGKWRPGKAFSESGLREDLKAMGVLKG